LAKRKGFNRKRNSESLSTGSHGFDYTLFLENAEEKGNNKEPLLTFAFYRFQWLKAAAKIGRSPV
jgi:hypothetical protein